MPSLSLALLGCQHPDPSAPPPHCELVASDDDTFYEDNPTLRDRRSTPLPSASPSSVGMDPSLLGGAADELAALPFPWSLLVLRHGALAFERYFHGSDPTASNNVHSASKSILSTATGIAIDRGELGLDDPIALYLPEYDDLFVGGKEAITVRHLLTMTGGLQWREDHTEDEIDDQPDWVEAILARDLVATPGTRFDYSTGSTEVLSAVLTAATGRGTCEYVHDNVLRPLGIEAERWGRNPAGIWDGGHDVYLTARELARFGLMALHAGTWDGEPIAPAEWMEEATSRQIGTGGGWGYGFGWWTHELGGHPAAVAWGFGGQLVYVVPDLDLVAVITTNTHDWGRDYDGSSLMERWVIPAVTGP